MTAYPSETQVGYCLTSQELTELSKQGGTATTAVIDQARKHASWEIYSWISARAEYASVAAMKPSAYTAGAGTYPQLEEMAAQLAADKLRRRMRKNVDEAPGADHASIVWAKAVARGDAHITAA